MRRQKKIEYLKFTLAQSNDTFLCRGTEKFLVLANSLHYQRVLHIKKFKLHNQSDK